MASPLPPDPYLALGVPKDATSAAVKMAHRKLVLKCHPVSPPFGLPVQNSPHTNTF